MENYYSKLGLSDANKDVNYSIKEKEDKKGYNIVKRNRISRDKRVRDAYEKQYNIVLEQYQTEIKELDDVYQLESEKLEESYEKSIATKKLLLNKTNNNKENTREKLRIKLEHEINEYESEKKKLKDKFEQRRKEITDKFQSQIEELKAIFNDELKTEELREIYKNQLDKQKLKKSRTIKFETAYDFFGISEERLYSFHPIKADEILRKEYQKRMEIYEKALLDKSLSFSKRKKIEALQLLCKNNYELIATHEKRSRYSKYLDNVELEEKYSKVSQFSPDLIYADNSGEYYIYVSKEEKNEEIVLENNKSIKKVATLLYKNSTGVLNSYINQYEVKRNIDNQEKLDYIYTDLDFQQLDIDENTGMPINPEYYNCVVNELLSEEMIKGSKLNSGYIGLVEKDDSVSDEEKKYHTTLIEKELHPTEQEYLSAVMIYEKNQKDKKTDIEQESDEGR